MVNEGRVTPNRNYSNKINRINEYKKTSISVDNETLKANNAAYKATSKEIKEKMDLLTESSELLLNRKLIGKEDLMLVSDEKEIEKAVKIASKKKMFKRLKQVTLGAWIATTITSLSLTLSSILDKLNYMKNLKEFGYYAFKALDVGVLVASLVSFGIDCKNLIEILSKKDKSFKEVASAIAIVFTDLTSITWSVLSIVIDIANKLGVSKYVPPLIILNGVFITIYASINLMKAIRDKDKARIIQCCMNLTSGIFTVARGILTFTPYGAGTIPFNILLTLLYSSSAISMLISLKSMNFVSRPSYEAVLDVLNASQESFKSISRMNSLKEQNKNIEDEFVKIQEDVDSSVEESKKALNKHLEALKGDDTYTNKIDEETIEDKKIHIARLSLAIDAIESTNKDIAEKIQENEFEEKMLDKVLSKSSDREI